LDGAPLLSSASSLRVKPSARFPSEGGTRSGSACYGLGSGDGAGLGLGLGVGVGEGVGVGLGPGEGLGSGPSRGSGASRAARLVASAPRINRRTNVFVVRSHLPRYGPPGRAAGARASLTRRAMVRSSVARCSGLKPEVSTRT